MSAHLPLLPILVPLVAAALALMFEHRRFGMAPQRIVAWTSMALMLLVAVLLVRGAGGGEVGVYLLGDWPARLGIALMVDRLAALMLLVRCCSASAACCTPAPAGTAARRISMRSSSSR
jgi:Formate hydrogenlyase subunit 3/Multisubunit Na+/H+ antiporter, MnhD subunit